MSDRVPHILLTGNSGFKLANFRAGLIGALLAQGYRLTVLAPTDAYTGKLVAMGCEVLPLAMERNGTSPLAEARLLGDVLAKIRSARPDFVFSYTIKNNIYAGIACRLLGIPFAPNVTGLGPAFNDRGPLNVVIRRLYRIAFRKARTVFFQNRDDQKLFLEAGIIGSGQSQLLPGSGVDLRRFAMTPLPSSTTSPTFLFVARLLWEKGVGVLVEATKGVRQRYPDIQVRLLGPLDPESRSAVSESQLQDWIREGVLTYLGSAEDVRPMLAEAHCLVLPSYYREGTPRSLLEACAMGRPVITTDSPGCRDVVVPGVSGLLCAPRDTADLARAMIDFIEMPHDQQVEMGAAARRHAERHYDEGVVIASYLKLLQWPPDGAAVLGSA